MKKRQLIAPTVLSLFLCGLLVDYTYFRQSSWSVINLIGKITSVLLAVFVPLFNPILGWIGKVALPASIITAVVILLFVTIARAKTAMREATPNADSTMPNFAEVVHVTLTAQPPVEQVTERLGTVLPRFGLVGKLTICFGSVGILFGVVVWIIAETFVSGAVEKESKTGAEVIAIGLSEIASYDLAAGRTQDLAARVASQALNNKIAYIYVEDSNGEIVVHEPEDLLTYLKRDFPKSAEMALKGINGQYRGFEIYETAKRLAKSNQGFVHVGLWRNQIEAESRPAAMWTAASIVVAVVAFVAVFAFVMNFLNRPFFDLVHRAERISTGDLALPLNIKSRDEIGDIAESLERMRSSLRAVTSRLD